MFISVLFAFFRWIKQFSDVSNLAGYKPVKCSVREFYADVFSDWGPRMIVSLGFCFHSQSYHTLTLSPDCSPFHFIMASLVVLCWNWVLVNPHHHAAHVNSSIHLHTKQKTSFFSGERFHAYLKQCLPISPTHAETRFMHLKNHQNDDESLTIIRFIRR